ncbi:MAG: proline racemase family protein [Desulfotignum sp.]|nr:proline racemase family protein [Desulfotignum sp.]
MDIERVINVIDTHTAGEPTRIVTGGLPAIKGRSMLEKRNYFEKNYDHLRTFLLREPRGHNDMFGAALLEPCHPEADLGVVFMSTGNYPQAYPYMCGHGTIGIFTVAVEVGLVDKKAPVTEICMETPDGLVKGWVTLENDIINEVEIESVPAFVYQQNVEVPMAGHGTIMVDISYNGGFCALCPVQALGILRIDPSEASLLSKKGVELRKAINEIFKIDFKEKPHYKTVDVIEFYDEPDHPDAHCKNVVIFGSGQIDRSPCGTGTSAKMAALYARGKLGIQELFVHESITGTLFKGRITEVFKENGYTKIIPRVASTAHITGFNQLVAEKQDPLKAGFQLK